MTTTVPVMVFDDADPEHDVPVQGSIVEEILKGSEVTEVIPGLVATSVYPVPDALIDRSENEATPRFAWTVVVPDSEPDPGFVPMAMVTAAVELVSGLPDPSRTSTVTGSPWEPTVVVITLPTAVSFGSPVNFSEHDPVGVLERGGFAGSSWKLLPGGPLKSFDCLAWIPHWEEPLLHAADAVTVKTVLTIDARFRLVNSAELDVTLVAPGAPVITKPAGAEICTEPSI